MVAPAEKGPANHQVKSMNHKHAIKIHAAAAYTLGELKGAERNAFEAHMLNCSECTEEATRAAQLYEDTWQVLRDDHTVGAGYVPVSFWQKAWESVCQPVPAAAFALILLCTGFSGYQAKRINELREIPVGQLLTKHVVLQGIGVAHGSAEPDQGVVVNIHKGQSTFGIRFDIPYNPSGESFSFYEIKVLTESGTQRLSLNASRQDAENPVDILLSTRGFSPGKYFVLVQGVTAENEKKGEPVKFPFELKFQD
ncbi:MAG: hypothetical protein DMG65_02270 [Candidatus Angelobacter sp. Gp1-AA117]|nr:MAG: hypothetical protein DMG65_02270 [Candidatus Angelobacter sp. Gp1-AA117]